MTAEQFIAIQNLENDIWGEELLGQDFANFRRRILAPKERVILDLKVQGLTNGEIAALVKTRQGGMQSIRTVTRVCYDIKKKFRTGQRTRIDNHPLIRAQRQAQGGK